MSMIMNFHRFRAVIALAFTSATHANNIQVSTLSLTGNTGTAVQIQFDLGWENSWRGGGVSNWDAAWVFVKYRLASAGTWHHARLGNTGHVSAAGSTITTGLLTPGGVYSSSSNPALGVFIHRSDPGNGNVNYAGTELNWAYSAQGLGYNDIAEVRVFAIEMVYVTGGEFAAGSGGTETSAFTLTTINTLTATNTPGGVGFLGGQAGGYPTGAPSPLVVSWPNGFRAFYCMKYEISQQGYVDFLNTLTFDQQAARTANPPDGAAGSTAMASAPDAAFGRNALAIEVPGNISGVPAQYGCDLNANGIFNEPGDGRDLACNYLKWVDMTAYLDWSALRPMTELEFEKACRGTIAPVANEFPWGTSTVSTAGYTLSAPGANNEGIASNFSTTSGNANYTASFVNPSPGVMRNGIFAANSASTGRITSGASYYGIMELAGNLYDRVVPLNAASGGLYTGVHGNGALNADGVADTPSWPLVVFASRGGAHTMFHDVMRVSDRSFPSNLDDDRTATRGGRGVRMAP